MEPKHNPSGTLPIFEQNAEELIQRLEADGRPQALALAREARELAFVFHHWRIERPDDRTRVDTIKRLFDLTRRAMDVVSSPSASKGPRRD
ncbi:MAG TPA: hypothetical protein VHB21_02465 [Minicystis sp.]|nr:hypothetical protein [Minicystis sp.]